MRLWNLLLPATAFYLKGRKYLPSIFYNMPVLLAQVNKYLLNFSPSRFCRIAKNLLRHSCFLKKKIISITEKSQNVAVAELTYIAEESCIPIHYNKKWNRKCRLTLHVTPTTNWSSMSSTAIFAFTWDHTSLHPTPKCHDINPSALWPNYLHATISFTGKVFPAQWDLATLAINQLQPSQMETGRKEALFSRQKADCRGKSFR